MTSPTQLTLAELRKNGCKAQVVEHWNMFAHVRQDLFGFIDVVALEPEKMGILAIQATSRGNVNKRIEKIIANDTVRDWLKAGNRVEVWGWSKKGKAGKRKLWELYKETITLHQLK